MLLQIKCAYANFEPRFFAHMPFAHDFAHERGMMREHELGEKCSGRARVVHCYRAVASSVPEQSVVMEHERGSVCLPAKTLFNGTHAGVNVEAYKTLRALLSRQLRIVEGVSKKINPHVQAHARASEPVEKK